MTITIDAEREQRRLAQIRYRVTEKGKATAARYNRSDNGHEATRRNKEQNGAKWAEKSAERQRERVSERPDQARAQWLLNKAVQSGRVIKPSACSSCASVTRLHGHHHRGYAEEAKLDVIWLCPACHKAVHREGVI